MGSSSGDSFGISGDIRYGSWLFSAGPQHRTLVTRMSTTESLSYYSHTQQRVFAWTASIKEVPGRALQLSPAFDVAVANLPATASNTTDIAKWYQIFNLFGTHYVCFLWWHDGL